MGRRLIHTGPLHGPSTFPRGSQPSAVRPAGAPKKKGEPASSPPWSLPLASHRVPLVTSIAHDHENAGDHSAPSAASVAVQAARRALGIPAKSSAAVREVIDEKTGEIQRFRLDPRRREYVLETDPDESRRQRYILQGVARRLLLDHKTPRESEWRVCSCLRSCVNASGVSVLYAPQVKRAHFGNLAICGSVWTCPVCSAKVSERRKAEIVAAGDLHKAAGGGLYMVTLTWSHSRHDNLAAMVKASREALTRLRKQRAYVSNREAIGYTGMIRALEVTHGDANGWHPHFHELWLTDKPLTERQLRAWRSMLFDEWFAQCKRAGLGLPNRKAGVDIRRAESAGEYIAKFGRAPAWGVAAELTKTHVKKGRNGSRTPWDLLRLVAEGEPRFGHLFRDYATAFFGARQVFWSEGLKSAMGVKDLSDEELARLEENEARVVCMVSKDEWRRVLAQPYESRALLLSLAESGGHDAVKSFLDGLSRPVCQPREGFS